MEIGRGCYPAPRSWITLQGHLYGETLMRLRLWHRLFLAQAALVLLTLVIMVALQQQRLVDGLLGYVNQLEVRRAERIALNLTQLYFIDGSFERLRERPQRLARIIDESGRGSDNDQPPRPPRDGGPMPGWGPGPPPDAPDRRRPPRPPGLEFRARLSLLDANGALIWGAPLPPNASAHPIALTVEGKAVGTLRLAKLPKLSDEWDLDFVRSQLRDSLVLSAVLLLLALLVSLLLARRLAAPLKRLADTAEQLSKGDFAARSGLTRSDEIGDLALAFDRSAEAMAQNRDARRRWTADISHELRTPVTVMRAELAALEDGVRVFDAAALSSLSAEVNQLAKLIEDLYQLSLSDIGALDYRFEPVDLVDVVSAQIRSHQRLAERAQLKLQLIAPATSMPLNADARRLNQLLANLLSNAVRYTDPGGEIRVTLKPIEGNHLLQIDDTAPGVPITELPRLTDPLYRADASRSRAHGGAGLGLAIAKLIVTAHGGTLSALPSPLGGVRIEIQLPQRV